MANNLAVIEGEFREVATRYQQIVPPGVNVEQLQMSLLLAIDKNPDLLSCNRQSLINSAAAALAMGVLADGYTGQGFLVPRKGKAEFQIGVKGIPTIAGRSGFVVNRGVILEGDKVHKLMLGTDGAIEVEPTPGNRDTRRVIWAWATASAKGFPNIVDAMDIDEIERVRKIAQTQFVWNAHFQEQAKKTIVHRLAKAIPVGLVHVAAAYDGAQQVGRDPYFDDRGQLREESPFPDPAKVPAPETLKATTFVVRGMGRESVATSAAKALGMMLYAINQATALDDLTKFRADNMATITAIATQDPDAMAQIDKAIDAKRAKLS